MTVLYVVLGLLVVVVLLASHAFAYVRGFRKGERHVYWRFYMPMASRFERHRREVLRLSLQDDKSAAQQNVLLYVEKRWLWNKALRHAHARRRYLKQIRRLGRLPENSIQWVIEVISVLGQKGLK